MLEGKLIAGPVERVTELAAGDYASFPIDVPHVYETERTGARALVLSYGGREMPAITIRELVASDRRAVAFTFGPG